MLVKDYIEVIKTTEDAKDLTFGYYGYTYISGVMRRAPMYVVTLGDAASEVIKLPKKGINKWGNEVDVAGFKPEAFQGNDKVTDIILHSGVRGLPDGAFKGCANLKRLTIPKNVKKIGRDVFAGCVSLEDVYYEGTMEQWEKIEIYTGKRIVELGKQIPGTPVCEVASDYFKHDPGNDALLKANIHFQFVFDSE